MIGAVQDVEFKHEAALYFLEGGHYLFRESQGGRFASKFVTARDVAAAFTAKKEDTGWLPAGVVRAGHCVRGPWYVYSSPAQKVDVLMGEQEITIPIPRIVMLGMGTSTYVWAVKGQHFNPQALACRAPFPNVYDDGRVCWGQNHLGDADVQKARGLWEMFFKTPFNRDLSNGKCRSQRDSVLKLYEELTEKRVHKFPEAELVEMEAPIGRVIERIVEA